MDDWKEQFKEKCDKYKVEAVITKENDLLLICPKMPDKSIKEEFAQVLPEGYHFKFEEGPRVSTRIALNLLLVRSGAADVQIDIKKHELRVDVKVQGQTELLTEKESPVWGMIKGVLDTDPFVESWVVKVNDEIMSDYNRIAVETIANQTRPERDYGFQDDDILNLQIALETSKDVNDFINSI